MADKEYGDTINAVSCPGDHIKAGIICRNLTLDHTYKLTQRDATVDFPQTAFKGRVLQAGSTPFQTNALPEDSLSGYTSVCNVNPTVPTGPRKGQFPKFSLRRPTPLANILFAPGGEIGSNHPFVKTQKLCWSIGVKRNPLDFIYYPFIPRRKNAFFWRVIQALAKISDQNPFPFPDAYVFTTLASGTITDGNFQGLPNSVDVDVPHIFSTGDTDGFFTVQSFAWMQYTWDTGHWPAFTFGPIFVEPTDLDLMTPEGAGGPCGPGDLNP